MPVPASYSQQSMLHATSSKLDKLSSSMSLLLSEEGEAVDLNLSLNEK